MALSTLIRPTAKAELEPMPERAGRSPWWKSSMPCAVVEAQRLQAGADGGMLDLGDRADRPR